MPGWVLLHREHAATSMRRRTLQQWWRNICFFGIVPFVQRWDVWLDASGGTWKHCSVVLGSLRCRLLLWRGFHESDTNGMRAWCLLRRRRGWAHDLSGGRFWWQHHAAQQLVHCGVSGRRNLRRGIHDIFSVRMPIHILLRGRSAFTPPLRRRLLLRAG